MATETKIIIDDALEKKIKLLGKLKGERAGEVDIELLLTSVLNQLIDDLIKDELEAAGVNFGDRDSNKLANTSVYEQPKGIAKESKPKTQLIPDMDHNLSADAEEPEEPLAEPTEEQLAAVEKIAAGEMEPARTKARPIQQQTVPRFIEPEAQGDDDPNVPDFFSAVASDIPIPSDIETDPEAYMHEVANPPVMRKNAAPVAPQKKRQALGRGMETLIPPPGGARAHTKAVNEWTKPRVSVSRATIDN